MEVELGDKVNYHKEINPKGVVTSSGHTVKTIMLTPNAFGTDVAWITGKSGCVALDALSIDNS